MAFVPRYTNFRQDTICNVSFALQNALETDDTKTANELLISMLPLLKADPVFLFEVTIYLLEKQESITSHSIIAFCKTLLAKKFQSRSVGSRLLYVRAAIGLVNHLITLGEMESAYQHAVSMLQHETFFKNKSKALLSLAGYTCYYVACKHVEDCNYDVDMELEKELSGPWRGIHFLRETLELQCDSASCLLYFEFLLLFGHTKCSLPQSVENLNVSSNLFVPKIVDNNFDINFPAKNFTIIWENNVELFDPNFEFALMKDVLSEISSRIASIEDESTILALIKFIVTKGETYSLWSNLTRVYLGLFWIQRDPKSEQCFNFILKLHRESLISIEQFFHCICIRLESQYSCPSPSELKSSWNLFHLFLTSNVAPLKHWRKFFSHHYSYWKDWIVLINFEFETDALKARVLKLLKVVE